MDSFRQSESRYLVPNFTLRAKAPVTLRACSGKATESELFWGSRGPIWNNDADRKPSKGRREAGKKMPKLQKVDNEVIFEVRVEVRSGRSEIVGVQRDALKLKLKIKISAPPVKGKANKALVHFLARKFGV